MRMHPMLFSAPMVNALLAGRKTQTRRVLKLPEWTAEKRCTGRLFHYERQPGHERHGLEFVDAKLGLWDPDTNPDGRSGAYLRVPIRTGDLIWVKETWRPKEGFGAWDLLVDYAADNTTKYMDSDLNVGDWRFPKAAKTGNVSPLFMPRWASRIALKVTDVRVQRLHEITATDAHFEGMERDYRKTLPAYKDYETGDDWLFDARRSFQTLWESINGQNSWEKNPWLVAYSFTVHTKNVNDFAKRQAA